MKTIKFVAFPQMVTGILLYGVHYILKNNLQAYNYTSFRWYFSDTLALIVSVPFFVNLQIVFMRRQYLFIGFNEIVFWWLVFSIYYEILMPQKIATITGDPLDIVAYAIGGCILYFSQDFSKKNILYKRLKND
jgi:hypothetical protein